jgi:outer membrane lipoprotein-sorting protein
MRTAIGAILLFPLCSAFAQPPTAREIVANVGAAYKNISQYEFVYEGHGERDVHGRLAFNGPDKYRLEGHGLAYVPDLDPKELLTIISDGSDVWIYFTQTNLYLRRPRTDDSGNPTAVTPLFVDLGMTSRYRRATEFADSAKYLREELLEIGDTEAYCYVVTVFPIGTRGPFTWWVDKRSYQILREDDAGNSVTFRTVKLNTLLPDDLFKFDPPPGARQVEKLP